MLNSPDYAKNYASTIGKSLVSRNEPQMFTRLQIHLGPKQFPANWTCFFGGPEIGPTFTVSRSRVNKTPIRHDFYIGTISGTDPREHSLR